LGSSKTEFFYKEIAEPYIQEVLEFIYPNICKQPEFVLKGGNSYKNQKRFIITKFDISLLGILNHSLIFFLFKEILSKLSSDFFEPSFAYFKDFTIVSDKEEILIKLVN
jgi:adenine-specific DNA-methyltransferase